MKAVVLAAGKGTRMLPLTENRPKVLVEVLNKPFLYFVLTNLQSAGFGEYGIIAGYMKEKVEAFINNYGFNGTIIEQSEQLGTGHAVLQAEQFVNGENFMVVYGDSLFDYMELKKFNVQNQHNYIGGLTVPDPEKYGVLITEGNRLLKIHEKPESYVGNLINAGLYKFDAKVFEMLKTLPKSARGEYELTDAVQLLAEKGLVEVIKISLWKDFGCLEDIPMMEKYLQGNWKNIND